MRTGKEYREALRDGRRVWIMGEGAVDDVTTHPATRAMVDEYASCHAAGIRCRIRAAVAASRCHSATTRSISSGVYGFAWSS